MKNTRILLISIPTIIIISAAIGCAITYGTAPNAALARIFIDIGALIALVSIAYNLPKPETLNTDDIVDGLRDLARNRFDRRLSLREQDELTQVRQAFNELAGTLGDSRDPSLTHIRYNPMNRVELRVTPLPVAHHSHHPELGQVRAAPELKAIESVSEPAPEAPAEPAVITYPDPTPNLSILMENKVSDHALEQTPQEEPEVQPEMVFQAEELALAELAPAELAPAELAPEPLAAAPTEFAAAEPTLPPPAPQPIAPPARPETYPSDIGAADLFFLFERFKAAHERPDEANIDFDSFLSTVKKAREDLIRAHHCRDVKFEVVSDAGAVALRPRLIR